MEPVDTDPSFEPQQRARSNTWPLPRPENYGEKGDDGCCPEQTDPSNKPGPGEASALPKKNSSRRNAWGNMSYADLITQAIQGSPEKRLTLSQIYDWMVQNVPYFKDKGDSNSSAGWKNSIRHNLSLHNRFMRVQNEGTGKSSWWMINPDAKPGKAARRRATSMETQKYEKRRGRVKKKVEALRNGLDATPSPSSSISESLDMFPESPIHPSFQLSPDFRPRASSNASSCGGRLSPIPAVEGEIHDGGDSGSPLSPVPWNNSDINPPALISLYNAPPPGAVPGQAPPTSDLYGADQLVDTMAETMKLGGEGSYLDCSVKGSPTPTQLSPHTHLMASQPPTPQPSQQQQQQQQQQQSQSSQNPQQQQQQQQHAGSNGYSLPPPYSSASQYGDYHGPFSGANEAPKLSALQRSPQRMIHDSINVPTSYSLTSLQALSPAPSVHSLSPPHSMDAAMGAAGPPRQQQPTRVHPAPPRFGPQDRRPGVRTPPLDSSNTTTSSSNSSSNPLLNQLSSPPSAYSNSPATNPASGLCALTHVTPTSPGAAAMTSAAAAIVTSSAAADSAMLRAALTQRAVAEGLSPLAGVPLGLAPQGPLHVLGPMATSASQMMGQIMALNPGIPNDLDLNSIDSFQGELECDVDQVIRHELSVDGNLDFNFTEPVSAAGVNANHGHHWVH